MPKRIQLSRKKGWRKPEGCIVVSRPSRWGNPYKIGELAFDPTVKGPHVDQPLTRQEAVDWFRATHSHQNPVAAEYRNEIRRALGGHDLACWCPLDQPCHADVLLEIANSPMEPEATND